MTRKITICAASFPPEKGGAPTRIYNLALLLRKAGYSVTVITAMPNYPSGSIFPNYRGRLIYKETVDEIRVIRLWIIPSNSGNLLRRALSLISYLSSLFLLAFPRLLFRRSDAVIISSPPLITAWATALMARLGGKKVVVNVSDIWPLTATEMGALKQGFLFRILQKMERRLYKTARAYTGQSQEILDHIQATLSKGKPSFLYRNLQPRQHVISTAKVVDFPKKQIVYAGNLGHAQGVLALCESTDFRNLGVELHVYGDGAERLDLENYVTVNPDRGVVLHRTITQSELNEKLPAFSAVLIPLKMNIHGAVPSKLFMAIANGLPVLFCGGGEGEKLVQQYELGWVSAAGDHEYLTKNLSTLAAMKREDEEKLRSHIKEIGSTVFSKDVQDKAFLDFLANVIE